MIARILIINDRKLDTSRISTELQKAHNLLLFSKSFEDAIRIVGTQSIDIVLISMPSPQSKLFLDFFSILRQLCGIIPIIGIAENMSSSSILPFLDKDIDDFIDVGISKNALRRKMEVLSKMKHMFDDSLMNGIYLNEQSPQKIVTFFHDHTDFLHEHILKSTEIVQLKSWPIADIISDSDLFLINASHFYANECCSQLRLKRINRYKPIVLTYNTNSKKKALSMASMGIGCTDVINVEANSIVTACKLNSLIKYKKLYDGFAEKLKKCIYMAAVDSTTEVYNRSFFDDYVKSKERSFFNSAVLMIDIDKFKHINDKYGHSFADSMLKYVSSSIKKHIRSSDLIARYGGDEFIIIMDNVSKRVAAEVANRIQSSVGNSSFKDICCTVSIGVCCVDVEGSLGIYDAVSIADKFMYIAKQIGGNTVKVCE
ncbi:PleD family two-component system response regulator [Alphaproteobacteria bacterium]|nr:PleD family two-component system response regulator [Alphaproteobacteria bacterium]